MPFELSSLERDRVFLLNVPLFFALFSVVRDTPVLLCRSSVPAGQRLRLALFSAPALPLVVVIADLGVQSHLMRP